MSAGPPESGDVQAPKVFISYRREETAAYAGRLYDAMAPRFGDANVFMDVDLEPGIDFVERITEAVGGCHVLLVVMGPRWASAEDEDGAVRIAEPGDFVRLEVATALKRPDVTVIPVLVSGAQMPDGQDLPQDIAPITRRNALELSDTRWRYDVGRLTRTLDQLLTEMTATHQMDVGAPQTPGPAETADAGAPARASTPPRRRLVTGIVAAAAAALVALGIVVLGGGSGGNDSGAGSTGIHFEPFTRAHDFTVEVPKGWHAILPVEGTVAAGKLTEIASRDDSQNLRVLEEERPIPAIDKANQALQKASSEAGFEPIQGPESVTFGSREAAKFAHQGNRTGSGPVTIVGYAFNAGGLGWQTRVSVPKAADSLDAATQIATQAAKTLAPR